MKQLPQIVLSLRHLNLAYDLRREACHRWFLLVFHEEEQLETEGEEGFWDDEVCDGTKHVVDRVWLSPDPR